MSSPIADSSAVPMHTQFSDGADPAQQAVNTVAAAYDEDVPARRLLAHDLEHIVWDDDGDEPVPPPD